MATKKRIDQLLVERELVTSREKAKRAIMAGLVFSGTERLDKPGMKIDETAPIRVKGDTLKYVGRGGLKLEKAMQAFQLDFSERIAMDIGASTGGFTDCMLQNGADKVYAIDVGYNQLAWKLRQDERVVVMERMNFRYATPDDFTEGEPSFASIDVSFISLRLILPPLKEILQPNGQVVALIKPQFEAGKEEVGKKGIVRDPKTHERVIHETIAFALQEGFDVDDLTYSPITGGDGNIEFLVLLRLNGEGREGQNHLPQQVEDVVRDAHEQLKKA